MMLSNSLVRIDKYDQQTWFLAFAVIFLLCSWSAILLDFLPLLVLPAAVLFALVCVANPKFVFYLFFFLLPFSIEIELPGGFGTDLPSEPIMLILTGIFFALMLSRKKALNAKWLTNPISLIIGMHLFWIFFSSIFAVNKVFAFKYFLAKLWYIIPFYFLPFLFLKDTKEIRAVLKIFIIGLFISIVYVMLRHASLSFSFDTINKAVRPIFRNHVNYSAILALALPYLWMLFRSSKSKKKMMVYPALFAFILLAIFLTYTRAAYVVVFIAIAGYFIVRWKLTLLASITGLAGAIMLIFYMNHQSNYLEYAPDYERTVAHYKFDNLVEATYQMEDVSTMERLYRWVAGFQMIKKKPILGFGPSNFYSSYNNHTVSSFQTYVSDNPEKSGIHNNYLMVFVEQGIIGFIIMLLLAIFPLLMGEYVYHQLIDPFEKWLVMGAILSFLCIDVFIIINDLLEADKVGPFYFLNAFIIAYFAIRQKKRA